jgi:hypothetical protein
MSPLEERHDQVRRSALDILTRFAEGKLTVLLTTRKLMSTRHVLTDGASVGAVDDDWRTFIGIDSETDDLPTGEERKHWAPDALAAKDVEIQRAEDLYRAPALTAAHNLIRRYQEPIQPPQTTTGSSAPDRV